MVVNSLVVRRDLADCVPQFDDRAVFYAPQFAVRVTGASDAAFRVRKHEVALRYCAVDLAILQAFARLAELLQEVDNGWDAVGDVGAVLVKAPSLL